MTDKTKMIYNDDNTIGVDEQSLNKLMDILTPRMKTQLAKSLHNKVVQMMDNHNNEANDQPNWFQNGNLNKYYEVNQ